MVLQTEIDSIENFHGIPPFQDWLIALKKDSDLRPKTWLIILRRSAQNVGNSYDFLKTSVGCLWLALHVERSFILTLNWEVSKEVAIAK